MRSEAVATHAPANLFEIPSPFATDPGRVLLLEPPCADADALRDQLLAETYARPFVIDDGEHRYLYFSLRLLQSAMCKRTPNALALGYTQKMMLFLLFVPRPRRIVLIGLGGGSLLKFCHHHLPATHLTAVELDADVIALREAFGVPADRARLVVCQGDGGAYLAAAPKGIDVLLVDAFDDQGVAPALTSRDFFDSAAQKLAGRGVLVVNLAGERERYGDVISRAMAVFDDRVIVMSVPEDGNHLLLAFNDPGFAPQWRRLRNRARQLKVKYGLDFPAIVDRLAQADARDVARRELLRSPAR